MEKKKPDKNTHWEISYNTNEPSQHEKATGGADFCPKRSKDRKTTYKKVNDLDH